MKGRARDATRNGPGTESGLLSQAPFRLVKKNCLWSPESGTLLFYKETSIFSIYFGFSKNATTMQIKGTLLGCGRTFAGSHLHFRNSPDPKPCGCLRRLSQQPQGLLWSLSQSRDPNRVFQRLSNGRWKACERMSRGRKKKPDMPFQMRPLAWAACPNLLISFLGGE